MTDPTTSVGASGAAPAFPFSQVVGQDDAKLALLLASIDPGIGGVLLRGQKGSAKTTLARGLAAIRGPEAPFVDLPLGATEDRLIGTLDLAAALTDGDLRFTPGLLAAADGGVLYVDEINLLADHLVDSLLDVAVSGINRIERESVSHSHRAEFVLVGSMNPEEGELRPQLLDRFGLCVEITAPTTVAERVEAVQRRLSFDGADVATASKEPSPNPASDATLAESLAAATPARLTPAILEAASELALAVGVEGLRADLVLCRAAAAYAGLAGDTETTTEHLRRVAPLVLAHRSRRNPFDPPVVPPEELADRIDSTLGPTDHANQDSPDQEDQPDDNRDDSAGDNTGPGPGDSHDSPPAGEGPARPIVIGAQRQAPPVAAAATLTADRGRLIRDIEPVPGEARPLAIAGSVRQLADRRRHDPDASATGGDIRHAVRETATGHLVILAVDTSGSMGAVDRAETATGTVLGLLTDAYQRRDHVALIAFRGSGAETVLRPTGSVEVARNRLSTLETGGPTPLAAGIDAALTLATSRRSDDRTPVIVLLTDGRATEPAPTAFDDALEAAARVRAANVDALVLDCETGAPRLGLAARIAEAMAAPAIMATDLSPARLTATIQNATGARR